MYHTRNILMKVIKMVSGFRSRCIEDETDLTEYRWVDAVITEISIIDGLRGEEKLRECQKL